MKKLFRTFIALAVIGSIATLASCTKTCDEGFEGDKCDVEVREKVIGTYGMTETCSVTGVANYDIVITKASANVLNVLISPFGGYVGATGTAKVEGNTITISAQSSVGFNFNGSGTISNDGANISLSYTISDGTNTESCSGTGAKK
jgi:hypothetical protein